MRMYPRLEISRAKICNNVSQTVSRCAAAGIDVCGVIKGCNGLPQIASIMKEAGVKQIGSSRIEHIIGCRKQGIPGPYLLLRGAGFSEIPDLVENCEMSLQSDRDALIEINNECRRQKRRHSVVIMADLGDLREGIWDRGELIDVCAYVEEALPYLTLSGIGVNLGCYGAIKPTVSKMNELVTLAQAVESRIGRKPEILSGGATTSYTLVHWGTMPPGINHLRIGDNLLLGRGLQTNWKIPDMDYIDMTTMKLLAEVIEVREKPSYPVGEFAFNAWGKRPDYTDRGIRKRALLAVGRADIGDVTELVPIDEGVEVIGGSSDHLIADVTEYAGELHAGDTLAFYPRYCNMMHACIGSCMNIVFTD